MVDVANEYAANGTDRLLLPLAMGRSGEFNRRATDSGSRRIEDYDFAQPVGGSASFERRPVAAGPALHGIGPLCAYALQMDARIREAGARVVATRRVPATRACTSRGSAGDQDGTAR